MKITFRVDKRGISGGRFVETPLFPLPQRFWEAFAATDPSLWIIFAPTSVEYGADLSKRACGENLGLWVFHRAVDRLSTPSRSVTRRKKRLFRGKWVILSVSTNFPCFPCVKLLFSTQFSTTCGKVGGKFTGYVQNRWKSLGTKQGFPQGQERVAAQLPLISLIISSSSVRKTGFWTMRFSMVSSEERTVEWSRSMSLPMLGRDISVICRMT